MEGVSGSGGGMRMHGSGTYRCMYSHSVKYVLAGRRPILFICVFSHCAGAAAAAVHVRVSCAGCLAVRSLRVCA